MSRQPHPVARAYLEHMQWLYTTLRFVDWSQSSDPPPLVTSAWCLPSISSKWSLD